MNLTIRLQDALPSNHLARFMVDVIAQLDLSSIYARYGERGGEALALEILRFIDFVDYLEHLLGRKVDVLTPAGIKGIRIDKVAQSISDNIIYV